MLKLNHVTIGAYGAQVVIDNKLLIDARLDPSHANPFYVERYMASIFDSSQRVNSRFDQFFLCSTWASRNFAHFICETLPRLISIEESGFKAGESAVLSCPTPFIEKVQRFLNLSTYGEILFLPGCRVTPGKLLDNRGIYLEEVNIGLLRTDIYSNYSPLVDSLGKYLPRPLYSRKASHLCYIKRSGTTHKRILNENELLSFLGSLNYPVEIVDPAIDNLETIIPKINNSFCILGAHGAALANLIFLPPFLNPVVLIEFMDNVNRGRGHFYSMYQALNIVQVPLYPDDYYDLDQDYRISVASLKNILRGLI